MAYMTTTDAPQSFFTARFGVALDSVLTRLKQRKLYRETFRSLNALNDRELADLGLNRAGLHRVSWDSALNSLR